LVDAWALALDGMDDAERLKRLGISAASLKRARRQLQ
jgi:hypothetical protein